MQAQLTNELAALPRKCYYCGSSDIKDKGPYLDTGMSFDYYGAVYTCQDCFKHLAELMGYLRVEDLQQLKEKNDFLIETLEKLSKELDGFNDRRNSLDSSIAAINKLVSSASFDSEISDLLHEAARESKKGLPKGEGSLDEGEGTSPESDDDSDVGELSADDVSKSESIFQL